MKAIHFTTILIIVAAYIVGAKYPSIAQKIGIA